jgi:hypothetical protein
VAATTALNAAATTTSTTTTTTTTTNNNNNNNTTNSINTISNDIANSKSNIGDVKNVLSSTDFCEVSSNRMELVFTLDPSNNFNFFLNYLNPYLIKTV